MSTTCPYCQHEGAPMISQRISAAGWVVFVVLLIFCIPLCWLPFVIDAFKEDERSCASCGEELYHHRADDMPAWATILIIGHVLVSGLLAVETAFRPPMWVHWAVWPAVTLGMSSFDLGKTILEEEVLVNKDIHHHDTTRRTISRFMAAIIIAVSIEALLLMFKSLLGGGDGGAALINAVWMLLAAVAMLAGLGVYLRLSREGGGAER